MNLPFQPESPLRIDEGGAVRIGNSRILFAFVVEAYRAGKNAEAICLRYPTLDILDVRGAIEYYLRNQSAVDDYLLQCDREGEKLRTAIESRQGSNSELKQRLLNRQNPHLENNPR